MPCLREPRGGLAQGDKQLWVAAWIDAEANADTLHAWRNDSRWSAPEASTHDAPARHHSGQGAAVLGPSTGLATAVSSSSVSLRAVASRALAEVRLLRAEIALAEAEGRLEAHALALLSRLDVQVADKLVTSSSGAGIERSLAAIPVIGAAVPSVLRLGTSASAALEHRRHARPTRMARWLAAAGDRRRKLAARRHSDRQAAALERHNGDYRQAHVNIFHVSRPSQRRLGAALAPGQAAATARVEHNMLVEQVLNKEEELARVAKQLLAAPAKAAAMQPVGAQLGRGLTYLPVLVSHDLRPTDLDGLSGASSAVAGRAGRQPSRPAPGQATKGPKSHDDTEGVMDPAVLAIDPQTGVATLWRDRQVLMAFEVERISDVCDAFTSGHHRVAVGAQISRSSAFCVSVGGRKPLMLRAASPVLRTACSSALKTIAATGRLPPQQVLHEGFLQVAPHDLHQAPGKSGAASGLRQSSRRYVVLVASGRLLVFDTERSAAPLSVLSLEKCSIFRKGDSLDLLVEPAPRPSEASATFRFTPFAPQDVGRWAAALQKAAASMTASGGNGSVIVAPRERDSGSDSLNSATHWNAAAAVPDGGPESLPVFSKSDVARIVAEVQTLATELTAVEVESEEGAVEAARLVAVHAVPKVVAVLSPSTSGPGASFRRRNSKPARQESSKFHLTLEDLGLVSAQTVARTPSPPHGDARHGLECCSDAGSAGDDPPIAWTMAVEDPASWRDTCSNGDEGSFRTALVKGSGQPGVDEGPLAKANGLLRTRLDQAERRVAASLVALRFIEGTAWQWDTPLPPEALPAVTAARSGVAGAHEAARSVAGLSTMPSLGGQSVASGESMSAAQARAKASSVGASSYPWAPPGMATVEDLFHEARKLVDAAEGQARRVSPSLMSTALLSASVRSATSGCSARSAGSSSVTGPEHPQEPPAEVAIDTPAAAQKKGAFEQERAPALQDPRQPQLPLPGGTTDALGLELIAGTGSARRFIRSALGLRRAESAGDEEAGLGHSDGRPLPEAASREDPLIRAANRLFNL